MFYIGLDVHQKRSSLCILNAQGKKVKESVVHGDWDQLVNAVADLPGPRAICFEASTGCGVLCERLRPLAQRIAVAHPGKIRLIFRAKKKNDRVDAGKLALLLFLDQVPKAYIPEAQVRAWRGLVEFRRATVDKRTRTKNALRALLRNCGIQHILREHPRHTLWGKKGVDVLRELPLPQRQDRFRRDCLLDELAQFEQQVKEIEKELDRLALDHAGVALLRSIPGVGPRTAEAVLAYIDQPGRFRRHKQVGAYFGLVPCQDASAQVNRLGHITREGPPTVRKLLTEAAWQGIRRSPTLRAFYERIRQGKKERSKIALVACAHHLVGVMLSMLKSGEVWRETVVVKEEERVKAVEGVALLPGAGVVDMGKALPVGESGAVPQGGRTPSPSPNLSLSPRKCPGKSASPTARAFLAGAAAGKMVEALPGINPGGHPGALPGVEVTV
jgi:transposase